MENENIQLKLNGKIIYSLEELKKNLNAEELVIAYKDGLLIYWLEFFFYEKTADKIRAINPDKDLIEQLTHILMESSEEHVEPPKIFSSNDKNFGDNQEGNNNIFKSAETLLQEADDCYAEKDYRRALSKYIDAYYLGNETANDKLLELLNALFLNGKFSPSEEKIFKSRKFLHSIIVVLTLTTILFFLGYFSSLGTIEYLNAKIEDLNEKYKQALQDKEKYKQQLDETRKDLEEARQEIDRLNHPVSINNIYASHGTVNTNNSNIHGNSNDILGDNNNIYGNDNRIHGNNNRVIVGKNNIIISGKDNKI